MPRTLVQFASGPLQLEGTLFTPPSGTSDSAVVVCHPHPQSGGDMHNNVVVAIAEAIQALGIYALTFNFRGVGRSEGAYDGGVGELEDARAALEYASSLEGVTRIGLAGYSFGAGIAAQLVDDNLAAVALIAPPARRLEDASALVDYAGPLLLMAGAHDHIVTAEALQAVAQMRSGLTEVVIEAGTDHFWRGVEDRLKTEVGAHFGRWLGVGAPGGE